MRIRLLLLVLGVMMVLAGCGFSLTPTLNVTPRFTPTTFGFEVTDDGIVIASNVVEFVSKKGSMGARIDGYTIEYLDPSGNPIKEGDSTLYSRGSLGVMVPPGLICEVSNPCTINSPDKQFVDRVSEPVSNMITLPGPIALRVLDNQYVGAKAKVRFTATTDNNQEIVLGPFEVSVDYPVKSQ